MTKKETFNAKLSQEDFLALAREKLLKHFPKSDQHEDCYPSERDNYFYFSGLWHIDCKLITPKIVTNLRKGAKMLSVGAGDGHLERLLVKGFNVPKDNIHVADKIPHKRLIEEGFNYHTFDMTNNWPAFLEPYDYIIFPESLGVALLNIEGNCVVSRFVEDIKKIAQDVLNNDGVSEGDINFYTSLVESDIPRAQPTFNILRQAYQRLSKGGEVRVSRSGGIQYEQIKAYVGLRFKKEFPNSKYKFSKVGPSIIGKS